MRETKESEKAKEKKSHLHFRSVTNLATASVLRKYQRAKKNCNMQNGLEYEYWTTIEHCLVRVLSSHSQ